MTRPPEKIMQVIISIEYSGEGYIEYSIAYDTSDPFVDKGYGPKTFTVNRPDRTKNELWWVDVEAWKLDDSYNLLRIRILKTDYTIIRENQYVGDQSSTDEPYGKAYAHLILRGDQ